MGFSIPVALSIEIETTHKTGSRKMIRMMMSRLAFIPSLTGLFTLRIADRPLRVVRVPRSAPAERPQPRVHLRRIPHALLRQHDLPLQEGILLRARPRPAGLPAHVQGQRLLLRAAAVAQVHQGWVIGRSSCLNFLASLSDN